MGADADAETNVDAVTENVIYSSRYAGGGITSTDAYADADTNAGAVTQNVIHSTRHAGPQITNPHQTQTNPIVFYL